MIKPLADRFWPKVIKADGCWKWIGAKHTFGYGMIRLGGMLEKCTASKASWLIHFGDIPPGMYVYHKCDTPECTNPEHLFLGSPTANCRDKEEKERGLRKFHQTECNLIKKLRDEGMGWRPLSRVFNADRNCIKTAYKYGKP